MTTTLTSRKPVTRLAFTTNRGTLADALTTVGLAVPKRPAVPVLGGVLLQAADGQLTLSATDYDVAVTVQMPGTAHTDGALLLDHGEFTKLLGALVKGTRKRDADALPLTVRTLDDGTSVVDLGGYTMPVTAYRVDDYPDVMGTAPTLADIERSAFARDLTRVMVTVGTDPVLPALTGVHLKITPGAVTLAGTDRYRLAVAPLAAISSAQPAENAQALVPGRPVASVVKRFTGDRVRIGFDNLSNPATMSLACDGVTVSVRTLADTFPPYAQLIPDTMPGRVQTDRAALLTATRRAAAVLDAKRQSGGMVGLTITSDSVSVAPLMDEHADAVAAPAHEATVHGITDTELIRFNPAYLTEALDSFTSDTIAIHTQGSVHRPVLLTDSADGLPDATTFLHPLMPMRDPAN